MSLPGHEKDRRPGKGAAGGAGGTSPEAMRPAQGGAAVGQRGTVKWFNLHKGFGFIRPATGGADVFVHISALQKGGLYALEERQAVGFDLEQDPETGRSSAINVRILP